MDEVPQIPSRSTSLIKNVLLSFFARNKHSCMVQVKGKIRKTPKFLFLSGNAIKMATAQKNPLVSLALRFLANANSNPYWSSMIVRIEIGWRSDSLLARKRPVEENGTYNERRAARENVVKR